MIPLLPLALITAASSWQPLADIYVDAQAGNCTTGTGSMTDPVCTINAAIALASPGDTIRIAPGTYNETVTLNMSLDLIGEGGAAVTIIDAGQVSRVVTVNSTTVTLDGLTLTGGLGAPGGGLLNTGTTTLRNSTIRDNEAPGLVGRGGGIANGGTLFVSGCSLENNFAQQTGGGIHNSGMNCTVEDTTLRDNVGRSGGGGFNHQSSSGPSTLVNCTVSGNRTVAGPGGGIRSQTQNYFPGPDSRLFIDSCTITENYSASRGGALFQEASNLGSQITDIRNSILVGNTVNPALTVSNPDVDGTLVGLGYIGWSEFNVIDPVITLPFGSNVAAEASEVIGPLQDNGGFGWTHALLPRSVAVDTGNGMGPFDQRGVARPTGTEVDRGAYEAFPQYCFGDGGASAGCIPCPCSNDAAPGTVGGCLNSQGSSASLSISGVGSVGNDTLRVSMTGGTPNNFAILTAGANLAPANPANPCFGQNSGLVSPLIDGLRCVVGDVRRLGTRQSDALGSVGVTTNTWGNPEARSWPSVRSSLGRPATSRSSIATTPC